MKKAASKHSLARYTYKMHCWKQQLTLKTLNLIERQTLKLFEEEEEGVRMKKIIQNETEIS
jgi:hypothetical protein